MQHFSGLALAIAVCVATTSNADAAVYNPYNTLDSNSHVLSVTPGFISSWWITKPPENNDNEVIRPDIVTSAIWPSGESPAAIRKMLQSSKVLGQDLSSDGCREGLGGVSGTNKKCAGNIFAIKVQDIGFLVFAYDRVLDRRQFAISMDPRSYELARMDVFRPLVNQVQAIPLPGTLALFISGLCSLGNFKRSTATKRNYRVPKAF